MKGVALIVLCVAAAACLAGAARVGSHDLLPSGKGPRNFPSPFDKPVKNDKPLIGILAQASTFEAVCPAASRPSSGRRGGEVAWDSVDGGAMDERADRQPAPSHCGG